MKKWKYLVCIGAAACCLYGCSEKKPEESPVHLEEYQEEGEETYQYMKRLPLKDESGTFLNTYILNGDIQTENGIVTAEKAGIRMETQLITELSESYGEVMEKAYKEKEEELKNSKAQNLKIYDMLEGDGCFILQMDYQRTNGKTIYPCTVYIKIDQIGKNSCLKTMVELDNSKTNKETAEMFREVLNASGIVLDKSHG